MACLLQVVMSTAAEVLLLASEAQPEPVSHSHPLSAVPGRPAADSTGGEPQRSSSAVAHSVAAAVSRVTGGAAEPETDNEGALKNEHGVITAVQAVMDSLLAATSEQTAACCTPAPHSTPAAEDLAVPEPDALCAPMDIDVEEDDGAVPAEEAICEPAAAADQQAAAVHVLAVPVREQAMSGAEDDEDGYPSLQLMLELETQYPESQQPARAVQPSGTQDGKACGQTSSADIPSEPAPSSDAVRAQPSAMAASQQAEAAAGTGPGQAIMAPTARSQDDVWGAILSTSTQPSSSGPPAQKTPAWQSKSGLAVGIGEPQLFYQAQTQRSQAYHPLCGLFLLQWNAHISLQ